MSTLLLLLWLGLTSPPPVAAPVPAGLPAGAPAPAAETSLRVFEIRYRDASEVSVLVQPALSPDAVLTVNRTLKTVTVIDRPEVVRQVEDFIRKFDVPPQAVLVRIVLEKAERATATGRDATEVASADWSYRPLAETVLEVLERGQTTQVFGPGDTFEIHVKLDGVDVERHLMHFEDVSVSRLAPQAAGQPPLHLLLFRTALDLEDRVPKVVMSARDPRAEEALVVRVFGLVRGPRAGGE